MKQSGPSSDLRAQESGQAPEAALTPKRKTHFTMPDGSLKPITSPSGQRYVIHNAGQKHPIDPVTKEPVIIDENGVARSIYDTAPEVRKNGKIYRKAPGYPDKEIGADPDWNPNAITPEQEKVNAAKLKEDEKIAREQDAYAKAVLERDVSQIITDSEVKSLETAAAEKKAKLAEAEISDKRTAAKEALTKAERDAEDRKIGSAEGLAKAQEEYNAARKSEEQAKAATRAIESRQIEEDLANAKQKETLNQFESALKLENTGRRQSLSMPTPARSKEPTARDTAPTTTPISALPSGSGMDKAIAASKSPDIRIEDPIAPVFLTGAPRTNIPGIPVIGEGPLPWEKSATRTLIIGTDPNFGDEPIEPGTDLTQEVEFDSKGKGAFTGNKPRKAAGKKMGEGMADVPEEWTSTNALTAQATARATGTDVIHTDSTLSVELPASQRDAEGALKVEGKQVGIVRRTILGLPEVELAPTAFGQTASPSYRSADPFKGAPEYAAPSAGFREQQAKEGNPFNAENPWREKRWGDKQVAEFIENWNGFGDADRRKLMDSDLLRQMEGEMPDARFLYTNGYVSLQQARQIDQAVYGRSQKLPDFTESFTAWKGGDSPAAAKLREMEAAGTFQASDRELLLARQRVLTEWEGEYRKRHGRQPDFDPNALVAARKAIGGSQNTGLQEFVSGSEDLLSSVLGSLVGGAQWLVKKGMNSGMGKAAIAEALRTSKDIPQDKQQAVRNKKAQGIELTPEEKAIDFRMEFAGGKQVNDFALSLIQTPQEAELEMGKLISDIKTLGSKWREDDEDPRNVMVIAPGLATEAGIKSFDTQAQKDKAVADFLAKRNKGEGNVLSDIDLLKEHIDNATLTEGTLKQIAERIKAKALTNTGIYTKVAKLNPHLTQAELEQDGKADRYDLTKTSAAAALLAGYQETRDESYIDLLKDLVYSTADREDVVMKAARFASKNGYIQPSDSLGAFDLTRRGIQVDAKEALIEVGGDIASVGLSKLLNPATRMFKAAGKAGTAATKIQKAMVRADNVLGMIQQSKALTAMRDMADSYAKAGLKANTPALNAVLQKAKEVPLQSLGEYTQGAAAAMFEEGRSASEINKQALLEAAGGGMMAMINIAPVTALSAAERMKSNAAQQQASKKWADDWNKRHPEQPITAADAMGINNVIDHRDRNEAVTRLRAAIDVLDAQEGPPTLEQEQALTQAIFDVQQIEQVGIQTYQELEGIGDKRMKAFVKAGLRTLTGQPLTTEDQKALGAVNAAGEPLIIMHKGRVVFTDAGLAEVSQAAPGISGRYFPSKQEQQELAINAEEELAAASKDEIDSEPGEFAPTPEKAPGTADPVEQSPAASPAEAQDATSDQLTSGDVGTSDEIDTELDRKHAEWQAGRKEVDDAYYATEPHSQERKEAREKRKQWEEENGQVPPPSSSNPLSDLGALPNKDSDINFSLAGTGWRLTGAKETSIRGKTILYVTNGKDGGWVEESDLTDQHRQILARASTASVDKSSHDAATSPTNDLPEPTEAQKKAGNYKVGKINVSGLRISIENPAGSKRSGKDANGKSWEVKMSAHYGYMRGTVGADGDQIDVFVKEGTPEDFDGMAFVIPQRKPDGSFDEHKVMIGYASIEEAKKAYKAHYAKGWQGYRPAMPVPMSELASMVKSGKLKKPNQRQRTNELREPIPDARTREGISNASPGAPTKAGASPLPGGVPTPAQGVDGTNAKDGSGSSKSGSVEGTAAGKEMGGRDNEAVDGKQPDASAKGEWSIRTSKGRKLTIPASAATDSDQAKKLLAAQLAGQRGELLVLDSLQAPDVEQTLTQRIYNEVAKIAARAPARDKQLVMHLGRLILAAVRKHEKMLSIAFTDIKIVSGKVDGGGMYVQGKTLHISPATLIRSMTLFKPAYIENFVDTGFFHEALHPIIEMNVTPQEAAMFWDELKPEAQEAFLTSYEQDNPGSLVSSSTQKGYEYLRALIERKYNAHTSEELFIHAGVSAKIVAAIKKVVEFLRDLQSALKEGGDYNLVKDIADKAEMAFLDSGITTGNVDAQRNAAAGKAKAEPIGNSARARAMVNEEFGAMAQALGIDIIPNYAGPSAHYVISEDGKRRGGYIEINPVKVAAWSPGQMKEAMREEMIHAIEDRALIAEMQKAGYKLSDPYIQSGDYHVDFFKGVYDMMSPEQIEYVKAIYSSHGNREYVIGSEFRRMLLQNEHYKGLTEAAMAGGKNSAKARKAIEVIAALLKTAVKYLRALATTNTPAGKQAARIYEESRKILQKLDPRGDAKPLAMARPLVEAKSEVASLDWMDDGYYDKAASLIIKDSQEWAQDNGVEMIVIPFKNPFGQTIGIEITDLFADKPGAGGGTKSMNYITELSEEAGMSIYLKPSSSRNVEFYSRFGFKRNPNGFLARHPGMKQSMAAPQQPNGKSSGWNNGISIKPQVSNQMPVKDVRKMPAAPKQRMAAPFISGNSQIHPSAKIGPSAVIHNSRIGPNATVNGTVLNSQIEGSAIIGNGAYIDTGSIVGGNARVLGGSVINSTVNGSAIMSGGTVSLATVSGNARILGGRIEGRGNANNTAPSSMDYRKYRERTLVEGDSIVMDGAHIKHDVHIFGEAVIDGNVEPGAREGWNRKDKRDWDWPDQKSSATKGTFSPLRAELENMGMDVTDAGILQRVREFEADKILALMPEDKQMFDVRGNPIKVNMESRRGRAWAEALKRHPSLPSIQGSEAQRMAGPNSDPLVGLPSKVTIPGIGERAFGPWQQARDTAVSYMKEAGMEYNPPRTYAKVDKDRASRIAAEFDVMKHDPQNPKVKSAYAALIKETLAQWEAIKKTGLKVSPMKQGMEDPYKASPRLSQIDAQENNHLWFFPTDFGFGNDVTGFDPKDNPLFEFTGEVIDGHKMRANDVFRIVHDYFGHFKEGVGFRADGEENAWRQHAAMFSPEARGALTSETRGQNSWLNFGPHGEKNRTAKVEDTVFADQKIGLMPEWTWIEGAGDVQPMAAPSRGYLGTITEDDEVVGVKVSDLSKAYHSDYREITNASEGFQGDWRYNAADKTVYWWNMRDVKMSKREKVADWLIASGQDVVGHKDVRSDQATFNAAHGIQPMAAPAGSAYSWMQPSGKTTPVRVTHAEDYAAMFGVPVKEAVETAFKRGWARVSYDSKSIYLHIENNKLTEKQINEAVNMAIERGVESVVIDDGEDYRTIWTDNQYMAAPSLAPTKMDGTTLTVSVRQPSGKNSKLSTEPLNIRIDQVWGSGYEDTLAETFKGYPQRSSKARTSRKVLEDMIDIMKANLRWLMNEIGQENWGRARLWYAGANRIAADITKEHGITPAQSAALLAVLSPQKDWFQNIDLAKRVLATHGTKDSLKREHIDHAMRRMKATREFALLSNEQQQAKTKAMIDLIPEVGRPYAELTPAAKSLMIRSADELKGNPTYPTVSPEGDYGEVATVVSGNSRKIAWQSYGIIEKAISVLEDGSPENISAQLGNAHKVRNFFNNISDPFSDQGFITIDTHAVAAALLEAIGGSSQQVKDALQGTSNKDLGLKGAYVVYAEAYSQLAEDTGLLPREVQSITWEAVRLLFDSGDKKNITAEISSLWKDYRNGKLTHDELLTKIHTISGGLRSPDWAAIPARTASNQGKLLTGTDASRPADVSAGRGAAGTDSPGSSGGDSVLNRRDGLVSPAQPMAGPSSDRRADFVEPGFYSELQRTIAAKMPNSMKAVPATTIKGKSTTERTITNPKTGKVIKVIKANNEPDKVYPAKGIGEQVKAMLLNADVTEDEIKWSGIVPWLNGRESVTKDEALEYLRTEGAIRFNTTTFGGPAKSVDERYKAAKDSYEAWIYDQDSDIRGHRLTDDEKDAIRQWADGDITEDQMTKKLAFRDFDTEQFMLYMAEDDKMVATYGKYQLPGGKGYREVVLSMPQESQRWLSANKRYRDAIKADAPEAELEALHAAKLAATTTPYTSGHYNNVPNYVAHTRLNERADASGKPGLFIEELQSDRHQAGRKKGYQEEAPESSAAIEAKLAAIQKENPGVSNDKLIADHPTYKNLLAAMYAAGEAEAKYRQSIPDAPYRKTWALALFKRALRDAAESGKEWIGWTTGDTQNERFGLEKHFNRIILQKPFGDERIHIQGFNRDGIRNVDKIIQPNELADHVGEELAAKFDSMPWKPYSFEQSNGSMITHDSKKLEGLDLKTGGEGMRGFYDNIVVREFGDYVKQWGAKVEKSNIERSITEENPKAHDIIGMRKSERSAVMGAKYVTYISEDGVWELDVAIDPEGNYKFSNISENKEAWSDNHEDDWFDEQMSGPKSLNDAVVLLNKISGRDFRINAAIKSIQTTPIWRIDITPAMRASIANDGQSLFMAGPRSESPEAAKEALEAWLSLPATAEELRMLREQALSEESGKRTVGDQKKAGLLGADDAVTRERDVIVQFRKSHKAPEKVVDWMTDGQELADSDPDMVADALLDNFYEGVGYDTPEQVFASAIVVARKFKEARQKGDPALLREAQALAYADGAARTENARILRSMVDPHRSPEERMHEFFSKLISTPSEFQRIEIEKAPSPLAKEREIAELKAQIEKLKEQVGTQTQGPQVDQKKKLEKTLEQVKKRKDRKTLVDEYTEARRKAVAEALKREGLSEEDIFVSANERLAAHESDPVQEAIASHPQEHREAINYILRGYSHKDIAQMTKLPVNVVATIHQEFRQKSMRSSLAKWVKKGNTLFDTIQNGLKKVFGMSMAAPIPLSQARAQIIAEAEIERQLNVLVPTAQQVNSGKMIAVIVNKKSGQEVTIKVPFSASDFRSSYRVGRAISTSESNAFDKIYEYWISFGLLSGPETHWANVAGNAGMLMLHLFAQKPMEAALNFVIRDPNSTTFREFGEMIKGVIPGFRDAFALAALAWDAEADPIGARYMNETIDLKFDATGNLSKVGTSKGPAIQGSKGRVFRVSTRFLLAMDAFFKAITANIEVGARAYRLGKMSQAKGTLGTAKGDLEAFIAQQVATPGSESWELAIQTSKELAFQGDNWLTLIAGSLTARNQDMVVANLSKDVVKASAKGDANEVFNAKLSRSAMMFTGFVMKFIFPFVKTPTNIGRIGARKAGLGSIGLLALAPYVMAKGVHNLAKRRNFHDNNQSALMVTWLAEQIQAAAMWMYVWSIAEGDDDDNEKPFYIVGSRPYGTSKPGEREEAYRKSGGTQVVMVRNSDGTYTPWAYGRYEPFATVLTSVVDTIREIKNAKRLNQLGLPGGSVENVMTNSIASFASQLQDKSFFQGFANVTKAIEKVMNKKSGELATDTVKGFLQGFVPNIVRQPLRNYDDTVRDSKKADAEYLVLPMGRFAEPLLDYYGRESEKLGNSATRLLIRSASKPQDGTKAEEMIDRWNLLHPDKKFQPSRISKSDMWIYGPNKERRIITDNKLKTEFERELGQEILRRHNELAASIEGFPDDFDDRLRSEATKAREQVRKDFLSKSFERQQKLLK